MSKNQLLEISSDPIWIPDDTTWCCDPELGKHCFNSLPLSVLNITLSTTVFSEYRSSLPLYMTWEKCGSCWCWRPDPGSRAESLPSTDEAEKHPGGWRASRCSAGSELCTLLYWGQTERKTVSLVMTDWVPWVCFYTWPFIWQLAP